MQTINNLLKEMNNTDDTISNSTEPQIIDQMEDDIEKNIKGTSILSII